MSDSNAAGATGELIVEGLLGYEGWAIIGRQVAVHGHLIDFVAIDGDGDEVLVEAKVWGSARSGRDTIKKAIADAYDLREAGETRPYVLILSHAMTGLLAEMLERAEESGAIARTRVLGFAS